MNEPAESLLRVLVELDHIRALVLDRLERDAPRLRPAPPENGDQPVNALHDLLVGAQRAVLGNPVAARTLQDLLVAQGRRYATTPEGAQLRDALVASAAVEELRRVWEAVSLNALDGPTAPNGVPDAWAELLADAVTGDRIDETLLARLRPDGVR